MQDLQEVLDGDDLSTNADLYKNTNSEPWSKTIKRRRLNWVGHLYRLPDNTPARQAMAEFHRKTKRPVGRPKPTWVALISKESDTTKTLTQTTDRIAWKSVVASAMATLPKNVYDDDDDSF